MNKTEALGKITMILAPYLKRSLNVIGNPIPEISVVLAQLEIDAYNLGFQEAKEVNND
jgi:hypothetical protein